MQTNMQTKNPPVAVAALDLVNRSEEILGAAAQMASPNGELHVVHVIVHDGAGSLRGNPLHLVHLADQVQAKLEQVVAGPATSVRRVVLHVRTGRPDLEIAQLASDIAADVVVVGTHDHGVVERLILGSVGASLIRNAPCPVLVCRPKTIAPWEQIQPPCQDCLAVQQCTGRKNFWCERHSQHHPRAHTYSEVPSAFGVGAQTFR